MVAVRNAWVQQDVNYNHSTNASILWKVFASRGLGVNAGNYQGNETVLNGCQISGNQQVSFLPDLGYYAGNLLL